MHVFILAAMTVDGFIGRNASDRSFDWTSEEDKRFYVDSIKRAKAVVMGLRTFRTFTRHPRGMKYVLYSTTPEEFTNPKPDVIQAVATKEAPEKVITDLAQEGYSEVAICGGAAIYSMFLKAGLVDTLYLTVEPVVFGSGVKLFSDDVVAKLDLQKTTHLNDQTLLLEYKVKK
jgi:dihydrofolate reductase